MVLVLASPADAAEPLVSEAFDPLLLLSSFSVAVSTSMGSSLSSPLPVAPFMLSELSLDVTVFFVIASTVPPSLIPFVFEESFAVTAKKCFKEQHIADKNRHLSILKFSRILFSYKCSDGLLVYL